MDEAVATEQRRPSIAKMSVSFTSNADADPDCALDAFHRLPDEIIEQILLATDPSGFASLILLNSKWRAISQRPHLYTHHLARCPSYATSHSNTRVPPADDQHLPLLRRRFAREVKRNLFEAYLRPKQTLIKLVSNSISSSSCPGGEGMQFGSSPRGHRILAYNSSRIHVMDVRNRSVRVEREFKIQRRPVAACISDDANTLAVLSTELHVDIYDLQSSPPYRKQSLVLDNKSHTISISSCGSVLAAAHDGGIEVSSLAASALSADKRAVKCDAVDTLAFSQDGTQILGSTVHSSPPSTVVLTAPYYDPGSQMMVDDNLSAMWTTSILFPNTSRDCSHAILLPTSDRGEPEWTFTYDRSFETFRAVRLDDLRNGTTYFTGPIPKAMSHTKLLPCTLPATTMQGELVSAGFHGKEIWVYGVPEDLDAMPEPLPLPAGRDSSVNVPGLGTQNNTQSIPSRRASIRGHDAESDRVPQWQILCDKLRNNLVAGFKLTEIDGVNSVRWVGQFGDSSCKERLVVTATGVTTGPRLLTEEENMDFVDGGRIALLDFDYALDNGDVTEITIEVGTDNAEPLTEERRDLATEVAIVRRRTVAQKRVGGGGRGNSCSVNSSIGSGGENNTNNALLRAATAAAARAHLPPLSGHDDDNDPLVPRIIGQHPVSHSNGLARPDAEDDEDLLASIEEQEAMDAPYAHSSPRSQTTLRRAATAAAVSRQLNPRTADGRPIEYRRADGRAEHPHESDADGWVPPPPPYQKEDPGDLPAFLRGPPVAPLSETEVSQLTSVNGPGKNATDAPLPASTPSVHSVDMDDMYDVSPQASPRIPFSRLVDTWTSSHAGQSVTRPCSRGHAPVNSPGAGVSLNTASASASASDPDPASSAPVSNSRPAAAAPASRPAASVLKLDIPAPSSSSRRDFISAADTSEAVIGRFSHAQTWPRQAQAAPPADYALRQQKQQQQQQHQHQQQQNQQQHQQQHPQPQQQLFDGAYPQTAPPSDTTSRDAATAAFFPVPSSTQIASLNKRISQGNPRRLSGNILNAQLWMDPGQSASAGRRPSEAQVSDSDRPLIISTPTGVSGSNDDASRRCFVAQTETPILSPIPRRPRGNFLGPGGTAQQLENIYGSQPAPAPVYPNHMRSSAPLPMWMRTPSNASRRTVNSMTRHHSRAELSATKNIKDARCKGRKMKKTKKTDQQNLAGDGSGWVDVSTPSQPKANSKCAIM
ncbi:hypothetical protein E4U54_000111 [Claviceps lovelessii]|nr:hypothetical protein E4U54_000111 [Claviceps lovelessii]